MRKLTKTVFSQGVVERMEEIMSDNTYGHPEYQVLQVEQYDNRQYVVLASLIDTGEFSTWLFITDVYGQLREETNFGQWKVPTEVKLSQKYFVRVDFDDDNQEYVTSILSGPNHFDRCRNEWRYATPEEATEKAEDWCRSFQVAGARWYRAINGERVNV